MVRRSQRKTSKTRRQLGRRGAVLLLVGGIYVLVGVSFAVFPPNSASSDAYSFVLLLSHGSLGFWGGVFITVGMVAVLAAFWRTGRDAWGYSALVVFTAIWATFGFFSTIFLGSPRGWFLGLSWSAFAGVLAIVSGMRGANE